MAQMQPRRAVAATAGALLAMGLSACSLGGSSSEDPGVVPLEVSPSAQSPVPASPPVPAGPRVTFPWKPGRPQLGMNVYWVDNPKDSEEVVRAKARRIVDYVVNLDANSIAISFPFFTRAPGASAVHATKSTPPPDRIGIALDEFHRSGVRTSLRPLLDEQALLAVDPKSWRGKIEPGSRDDWFATYQKFLTPYLKTARDNHAATFVIGSELNSLQDDPRWRPLIKQSRRVFDGEIAYAANWESYVTQPFDMPVDQLGVDAYFPVKVGDDAPISRLVRGWNQWLDRRSRGALPKILLYEVGAVAEDGAYHHPGIWGTAGRSLNLAVQARWFTAVCQVARERDMAGLYWWKLDFHTDPAAADMQHDVHDSFVGRPGEGAIQSCFSAWGSAS